MNTVGLKAISRDNFIRIRVKKSSFPKKKRISHLMMGEKKAK